MEIKTTGLTVDGVPVCTYTLRSASGLTLQLTNLGAAALAICLPDGTDGKTNLRCCRNPIWVSKIIALSGKNVNG